MQTQDSNLSGDTYREFIDEFDAADQLVAEAVGHRKDIRARAKGAGFDMAALDQARRDGRMAAEIRQNRFDHYRLYMGWQDQPLAVNGSAAQRPVPVEEEDDIPPIHRDRISLAGAVAARAGRARGTNPWPAGGARERIWDEAWQQAKAAATVHAAGPDASSGTNGSKRPGRPRGAKDSQPRQRRSRRRGGSPPAAAGDSG